MKTPFKAIIIDDQSTARDALKQDLIAYCFNDIQIAGEAATIEEAVLLFKELKPNLIFLDIDLQKGTGFDFLEKIAQYDYSNFKVIFTTAFNQFAIKAIKFSAFDYLLKPIDSDDLINSINRLKKEVTEKENYTKSNIDLLLENSNSIELLHKKLAISTQEKIHYVYINNIIRCESSHNYTTFFLVNKTKLMVSKTIKEYESLLDAYNFIRPHQRHLLNIKYIQSYLKEDGGCILLTDNTKIPVSRRKKEEILQRLNAF